MWTTAALVVICGILGVVLQLLEDWAKQHGVYRIASMVLYGGLVAYLGWSLQGRFKEGWVVMVGLAGLGAGLAVLLAGLAMVFARLVIWAWRETVRRERSRGTDKSPRNQK